MSNNCDCVYLTPSMAIPKSKANVSKLKPKDCSHLSMAPIVCVNLPEHIGPIPKLNSQTKDCNQSIDSSTGNISCGTDLVSKMSAMPFSKSTTDVRVRNADETGNCNKSNIVVKQLSIDQNQVDLLDIIEPGMVALSKSETNIFDVTNSAKLSIFNVVSLNDLNDLTNTFCNKPMNDFSKNQMLNNISDNEIGRHFFENESD